MNYFAYEGEQPFSPFNKTNPFFSSNINEEKHSILNSNNVLMLPGNFNNYQNFSGSNSNITNNINIKNVNIISCNDSSLFNHENNNKNLLLLDDLNINNNFLRNNNLNNKIIYFNNNNLNNYSNNNENNNYKDKFHDLNQNLNNITFNFAQDINKLNSSINNPYNLKQNSIDIDENLEQNYFLNYISNLKVPLTKLLMTKKGISEIEKILYKNKNKNIDILLQLLNKEGLTKLMKNKFGNYFIQGLINNANYEHIKFILFLISSNFVDISENISGTYVIQKLLEKINNVELRLLVLKSIENRELEMAFNSNGTYVFQKIIDRIPDIERTNLNEIIINNIIFLSVNPDCVFIVEKFIETITIKENKIRIQNIIFMNCLQLANNPYGNYLIQFILKVWKNEGIGDIQNIIIENANYLVQQRYSSNVIEKCIEIFGTEKRKRLINSMCLKGDILELIKNQYGHYVLNKTIIYIEDDVKIEIEKILNDKMPEMNKKEKSKSKKFISLLKDNNILKNKGKKNK